MPNKPFIQFVFSSLDDEIVKNASEHKVAELVKAGYSVKVFKENYLSVWDNGTTHMIIQTTVMATMTDKVEIN